jgi:hypothetical protein
MSVGFAAAVADGLRYNNIPVSFEPGYETRGNGFVFPGGRPQGLLVHHTGSDYGTGLSTLINGRPDLDPPLCNSCGYPDGRVHIIAAQPANHAGAAAGRSLGPFAAGGLFNPRVWGHEIMYPGVTPMTAAQRHSALVLGGVISGILGHSTPEWVRLHAETSSEGKWDPGEAPGKTIDGARFRADIWPALLHPKPTLGVDDMPAGEWVTGTDTTVHKVTFPVGPAVSSLTAKGWLSLDPSEDSTVEVTARGKGTAAWLAHWGPEPVKANARWWKELPDGTEGCTVRISTVKPGVAGWCLELKPA